MDWLAKEVIEELRAIIERQSTVLDQVKIRKEDASYEYELNKKIEDEMMQEEWMMRRAIALLKDAYENVYHTEPNLKGINKEEPIFTGDEKQNSKRRLYYCCFQFIDGHCFFLSTIVDGIICKWLSIENI